MTVVVVAVDSAPGLVVAVDALVVAVVVVLALVWLDSVQCGAVISLVCLPSYVCELDPTEGLLLRRVDPLTSRILRYLHSGEHLVLSKVPVLFSFNLVGENNKRREKYKIDHVFSFTYVQ